ncbi:MAG: hypothetical protein V2A65_06870 [Candidatus Omnitrophota bacterium]
MDTKSQFDLWKESMPEKAENRARILPSEADRYAVPFLDERKLRFRPGTRAKPAWLLREGFCSVGCWEPLAWRRHTGLSTTWAEEEYAFEHSQAFLDDIKRLGCNVVIIPFDCGHGKEIFDEECRRSKLFAAMAHESGLKVGTYFRMDNVWPDTLSEEELVELGGGFQRDAEGSYVHLFGSSSLNPCYHHDGPVKRLKRSVERAIKDIKTDILHLDGMIIGNYEGTVPGMVPCRCQKCTDDFHAFLFERYGRDREIAWERFGHPFLDKVTPPSGAPPFDSGPINPEWCEWVAFRCNWTTRILSEIALWTKEMNPEVMIEINNALPAVRENAALALGCDVIGTGYYTDANWSEDGFPPRVYPDGIITQRVRQFKLCRAANQFALSYMAEENERLLRQNLAHTAAFNSGNIGCIGFPPHMNFSNRYNVHFDVKCRFMEWLNAHREYFRDTVSAARIALWRPRENMAVSGKLAYAAAMRMEQLLIETRRGFDIVFEESPKTLQRYDLLILPNVECMSLRQIEEIFGFIEKGGSVLIGQDTGTFDLWHRRRVENPWNALFGGAVAADIHGDAMAEAAAGVFAGAGIRRQSNGLLRAAFGKGKAVFVPMVVDPTAQPSLMTPQGALNWSFDYTNWTAPDCAKEINHAVRWLLQDGERFTVTAERGVLAEFLYQEKPARYLVHLVNLTKKRQSAAVDVHASLQPKSVEVLFPPTDKTPKWKIEKKNAKVRIFFDYLDTYAVVVLPV